MNEVVIDQHQETTAKTNKTYTKKPKVDII